MKKINFLPFFFFFLCFTTHINSQFYPPQTQLVYQAMPTVPKPAYLVSATDPTFNTRIIRIGDQVVFDTKTPSLDPYHHYSKDQAWNSDGTLILLNGWPAPILDGNTFSFVKFINPPGGHHTWSNTQPNIIFGSNNDNTIRKTDVNTNITTIVKTFTQYTKVDFGAYEGNMSNDDRYIALQCSTATAKSIVVYDLVSDAIVSTLNAPIWPNNVAMSQSGNYVLVQWDVDGTAANQGIWAYNRSNMTPVRNVSSSGGGHYDYGYDTQGNEVVVGTGEIDRGITMIRIDNGIRTNLLGDNQMSWFMHISCRNLGRPGYAYLTEFQDPNTQTLKPNYQKIFAVKLDPNANNNALTETFAHVHHSTTVDYERSPFGTPNRNGTKVMFRSDWMLGAGEIDSYVAYVPSAPDTQTPTVPTGLFSSAITSNSFTLNWTPSSDNVSVTGYDIYKGGVFYGSTTSATNLNIAGLNVSSTYSMTVKARDAAGNVSAASTALEVTTKKINLK